MFLSQLFARKSLEQLQEEVTGDNRLRRALGPIGLTSLGVGAIIGAGIFVMTGRVAANEAGPAILISFLVAGFACTLAALCYAEFASMAPVAGSAYTYAYATLGELFAWIIGWDLILEYAMSCATVAASWSKYLNEFLFILIGWQVPDYLCHDPFSQPGAWFNLPAVLILALTTIILVIGIRESATSNNILVMVKTGVVLFIIAIGASFIARSNWTDIPVTERKLPEELLVRDIAHKKAEQEQVDNQQQRAEELESMALFLLNQQAGRVRAGLTEPVSAQQKTDAQAVLDQARKAAPERAKRNWGMLGLLGIDQTLTGVDDSARSNFVPYGLSGIMLGAAIVFFAFIGFDSISTHAEEAKNPQRDVPLGILGSLFLCTLLYLAVAAVITGMEPYPQIDTDAAVASAFRKQGEATGNSLLRAAAGLIAAGALAGMTSVLLITFQSQARVFLAMARDGLLPHAIFGKVHPKFKTPHISTLITGGLMMVVAAFTPILVLEEMVNIGTLFAFVVVCMAVFLLRLSRPDARRPFSCPLVYIVAPLGVLVNLTLMLFLPPDTWLRLLIWLAIGLVIYFSFGNRFSRIGQEMRRKQGLPQ